MLTFQEKKAIYDEIISREEKNYADSFNNDLDLMAENYEYYFLNSLNTLNEIEYWIDKLKSRLVMKEDVAGLEDIIHDYIEFG